jgi:hypothetical protein
MCVSKHTHMLCSKFTPQHRKQQLERQTGKLPNSHSYMKCTQLERHMLSLQGACCSSCSLSTRVRTSEHAHCRTPVFFISCTRTHTSSSGVCLCFPTQKEARLMHHRVCSTSTEHALNFCWPHTHTRTRTCTCTRTRTRTHTHLAACPHSYNTTGAGRRVRAHEEKESMLQAA